MRHHTRTFNYHYLCEGFKLLKSALLLLFDASLHICTGDKRCAMEQDGSALVDERCAVQRDVFPPRRYLIIPSGPLPASGERAAQSVQLRTRAA